MRAPALAALLLALAPLLAPPALAAEHPTARLDVEIRADRSESLVVSFAGLDAGTEYRGICMPARANVLSVEDGQGALPHERRQEGERATLQFRPRTPEVVVTMERPAATDGADPLWVASANFCTTADARVEVRVRAAEPLQVFFASAPGRVQGGEGRWTSEGPNFVTYAYEAPLAPGSGLVRVDAPPFRLYAPAEREEETREVASIAGPALTRALRTAGIPLPWSPLRVHYGAQDEFSWEAGHYGGDGIVAVKPGTLDPVARDGYPYVGAKVLVHEAFHAASAPHGKGQVEDVVAWWLEGSARHAEREVDRELPNARRHCEESGAQVQCWFFDDRIARASLDAAYAPGFRFQTRWQPSDPQSDETRRFYYAYSEYIVAAYLQQAGPSAYRNAWADAQAAFRDGTGCPCAERWLETRLLAHAPNLTRDDLYKPWASLRGGGDGAAFEEKVASLVQAEQVVDAPPLFGLPIPGAGAGAAILAGALAALALALARPHDDVLLPHGAQKERGGPIRSCTRRPFRRACPPPSRRQKAGATSRTRTTT